MMIGKLEISATWVDLNGSIAVVSRREVTLRLPFCTTHIKWVLVLFSPLHEFKLRCPDLEGVNRISF